MSNTPKKFNDEDQWTTRLRGLLHTRKDVIAGIGDDAAVVRPEGAGFDFVYTTDAAVESTHFLPGTEPQRIGHKMAGRLLSDLAAMGAVPDHVLLNLVVPPDYPAHDMEAIYKGAEWLVRSFGAAIVGGDTIQGAPLALHGFAAGHVPQGKAVLRSGAREGDLIFVTGRLGGSIRGKHLDFIPRVREGIWLREGGWATAMMDLSDGIARDLPRLCAQSGVGAELLGEHIPAELDLDHALKDGEDYELIFTVKAEQQQQFWSAWRAAFPSLASTSIGTMRGSPENIVIRHADGSRSALAHAGYDHFGNKTGQF